MKRRNPTFSTVRNGKLSFIIINKSASVICPAFPVPSKTSRTTIINKNYVKNFKNNELKKMKTNKPRKATTLSMTSVNDGCFD